MSTEQLKIVVVGHVDHGKSTLIGRLFYDTGALPEGRFEQLEEVARRRGVPFEFANLTDGLQAERDQNITIDTAQIWLRTPTRHYVLIDAPGHREFLKNMVTGAASAHAALLLIDASEGMQEQSRRHGYLLKLLGLTQVVVLINKMDLCDYDEGTFRRVERECAAFLAELGLSARRYVPLSARQGDNVAQRGPRLSFYDGPTVLEALAELHVPPPQLEQPLRLPIQDVYRFDQRRILAGRVESGSLRVGDRLVFLPGGKRSTVRSIERWGERPGEERTEAVAGESVGITLTEPVFVERGQVACLDQEQGAPAVVTELSANLFWMGRAPLQKGRRYRLKLTTQEVECEVAALSRVIDASTLAEEATTEVGRYQVADLVLRTRTPVAVDLHRELAPTGRFVIVDGHEVAGGGIVAAAQPARAQTAADGGPVLAQERAARNGHPGRVVRLLPGEDEQVAYEMERAYFQRGVQVYVLPRDRVPPARREETAALLADAGMVVILPAA